MGAFERLHKQAVSALAGHNAGAVLATFEGGSGGVELELALLRRCSMALHALALQQGLDLLHVVDGSHAGRGEQEEASEGEAHGLRIRSVP